MVNLSSITLTDSQYSVLSLGPKFCPTPRSYDQQQLIYDVREGCRRLRLKELFYHPDNVHNQDPPRFYKNTGYQPPAGRDLSLEAFCNTLQSRTEAYQIHRHIKDNLNKEQRCALTQLRELVLNRTIRISSADKGGAVVIQDVETYAAKAERQLGDKDFSNASQGI